LLSCNWFLAILSKESSESKWVRWEVNWAMEHRVGKVLAVDLAKVDPTSIHIGLFSVQRIDFSTSPSKAFEQILKIIKPSPPPAAPKSQRATKQLQDLIIEEPKSTDPFIAFKETGKLPPVIPQLRHGMTCPKCGTFMTKYRYNSFLSQEVFTCEKCGKKSRQSI
ncbi:MAG: hypothetical protein WCF18_06610, partial [Chthoniobacteraceae bacterium]